MVLLAVPPDVPQVDDINGFAHRSASLPQRHLHCLVRIRHLKRDAVCDHIREQLVHAPVRCGSVEGSTVILGDQCTATKAPKPKKFHAHVGDEHVKRRGCRFTSNHSFCLQLVHCLGGHGQKDRGNSIGPSTQTTAQPSCQEAPTFESRSKEWPMFCVGCLFLRGSLWHSLKHLLCFSTSKGRNLLWCLRSGIQLTVQPSQHSTYSADVTECVVEAHSQDALGSSLLVDQLQTEQGLVDLCVLVCHTEIKEATLLVPACQL
mmetsp:Transcript_30031/g.69848  ORF Transcript_30031/g.69848 Transcript_30031/m.69848 type:complete len:261 (-) Transcript_30031:453-1235(-)